MTTQWVIPNLGGPNKRAHTLVPGKNVAICGWRLGNRSKPMAADDDVPRCPRCKERVTLQALRDEQGLAGARLASDEVDRATAAAIQVEKVIVTAEPAATLLARIDLMLEAADKVWKAFLKYGPVDDGRPEGDQFDDALMNLRAAYKVVRKPLV